MSSGKRRPRRARTAATTPRTHGGSSAERRASLKREALALLASHPEGLNRYRLAHGLGKKHGFSDDAVLNFLTDSPEFTTVGFMVKRRDPPRATRRSPDSIPTWDSLEAKVGLYLRELDTDSVHVRVYDDQRTRTPLRLRIDHVTHKSTAELWLACLAQTPGLLNDLLPLEPYALQSDWTLPLLPNPQPGIPTPAVLVWRSHDHAAAASQLRKILADQLQVESGHVNLEKDTCTPAELERRIGTQATIRRIRERKARTALPVTTCDHCGQPLSDPTSVKLGIGPECLKYYSDDVIRAIISNTPTPRTSTAKPVTAWLQSVITSWRGPA